MFCSDFKPLVAVGGEKIQENIDQKKEIDEVNDLGTKFVCRMPESDLERYQRAAYQDKNQNKEIPADSKVRMFADYLHIS